MSLKVTEETPDNTYTEPWEKMHPEKLSPYACFYSKEEYWKVYEEYGKSVFFYFPEKDLCVENDTINPPYNLQSWTKIVARIDNHSTNDTPFPLPHSMLKVKSDTCNSTLI